MKGIKTSKELLFITIFCLLCLPYNCDIKNDAARQSSQGPESAQSDTGSSQNVPSQQEKKSSEGIENSSGVNVEPNVKYVNNINQKADVLTKRISEFQDEIPPIDQKNAQAREGIEVKNAKVQDSSPKLATDKDGSLPPAVQDTPIETLMPSSVQDESASSQPLGETIHLAEPLPVPNAKVEGPVHLEAIKPVVDIHEHQQPHYDGMPSFDEWKKMMLAEQEKGGKKMPSLTPPGKKISSQKRRRNYASYECGAKIVAVNSEAEMTGCILNELVDEYMLNPCRAKIWFVIELCETVQATQIELANFELFSSAPKEFAVYSSDNFPTRDWVSLGSFTAAELRVLQSFELKQEGFGKFIKIELLSHYGKEFYCPLSVVRIFGTSMVDEYEEMEILSRQPDILDDDLDRLDISVEVKKTTNIFGSATDAVMNIIKKAAHALGHHDLEDEKNETSESQQNMSGIRQCKTVEDSSEKCKVPLTIQSPETRTFNVSGIPSSTYQSLFRLLHRCDQCVPSRIRYYSSAQPQCRFFQAAFGPLMFQNLCDWFQEHPLVFAQESSSHNNKASLQTGPQISTPSKSPPPQILVVPLDNETAVRKQFLNGSTISNSDRGDNITQQQPFKTPEVLNPPGSVVVKTNQTPELIKDMSHTIDFNNSQGSLSSLDGTIDVEIPTVTESILDLPRKATIPIQETTIDPVEDKAEKTNEKMESGDDNVTEVFTEADVEEFIASSEGITIADATEVPPSAKENSVGLNQEKLEPVSVGVPTASQKESVFMRMNNRIKALELNMSLSSQYLQELSQRYRRQMDEMQRAFNRTIGTLNDTAKKAAERDIRQQEILNGLQVRVQNLTDIVEGLLRERATLFRQMTETHICIMVIEAIVMITIMSLCVRRIKCSPSCDLRRRAHRDASKASLRLSKRRSSVDSCTPPVARKVKKRSASEEALSAAEELFIIEPLPVLIDPILKAKKKNRKRNRVQRSVSQPTVQRPNSGSISKRVAHSDGCVNNSKSRGAACENCYDETVCGDTNREKRVTVPLKNLTNGTVGPPNKCQKIAKDKFSFRKFLRLQKRDSI